ncbi:membrane protein [Mycolicibacterium cyprinidarum]|uniref:Membrane protein n=1 Tax=Mycolicibacterium cyprinidarum TaxID=2860311 RepID=A0ABQ4V2Z6_9MYCO|nr:membrane protein [Mycolicibacterium sp. NGTWSNA01]GJF12110.1 membrane protein [Mycolicibacterium sp. NGTWS1803]GJF13144.1 membrane protein [Mycolicibacterium sp. NGTWS0302]
MTEGAANAGNSTAHSELLFFERGGSWLWLLAAPAAGIAMVLIQFSAGYGIQWLFPTIFFLLMLGFLSIQIKAARLHTSVALTVDSLRQGCETIQTREIVQIHPPATGREAPKWQSSRALGELTGVPRGRSGIGMELIGGRTVQAWARKHQRLRAALVNLVDERIPPESTP